MALAMSGCGGTEPIADGGWDADTGDAGQMAAASVTFAYDDESGSQWTLDAASLGVTSIRLHNDRGSAFDATLVDLGEVTVEPESELLLEEAIPATYGRATLDLAPDTFAYSYRFEMSLDGDVYVLQSTEALSFEARCTTPATSTPSSTLNVALVLPIDGLVSLLEGASLPPAMGAPVILDDTSAPSLIASVTSWLESAWTAECSVDDGG